MTLTNFGKKSDIFCGKILGKYFDLFFEIFQLKFSYFGQKNGKFYKILEKIF